MLASLFMRRHSRRASGMRAIWLAFALAPLGCGGPKDAHGANRALEIVVSSDAETLDPRYAVDAVGLRVTRMVHAGLVRLDPKTLEPVPYLARAWQWQDEKTLVIELRPDLRFHSGAPFEARDVVETLRAFADPKVGSRHARVVDAIDKVYAEGSSLVVITLKRPHATLLTDLELPILRADQAFSPPAPNGTLDGLGPYKVAKIARGEIDLVPASGALDAPSHAVTVRTVHDENARALRLMSGSSDVDLNVISPTLLSSLEGREGLSVVSRPGANLTYAILRSDRPPFEDVTTRRAFSSTIDRDLVVRTFLAGHAQAASTLLPPTLWAHTDLRAIEHVPTPPLLRAHVTLLTSTDRLRVVIARFVAQELNDAGWDVEVVPLELGAMIARLNAGDFDAAFLQIPELTEPNTLRVFMHSTYIPPAGANRARIASPLVDALLDAGDRTIDVDARRRIYAELERKNRDAMYLVPLWHEDQVAVRSARAKDFVPSAEGRWLSLATIR